MKRQLITSGDKRFIDKNADEYILTSTNFLTIVNSDLTKEKCNFIEYPFWENEYSEAIKYIDEIQTRIIQEITPVLNKELEVTFSEKQWDTFIGMWSEVMLFDLYAKYTMYKGLDNQVYLWAPDSLPIDNIMGHGMDISADYQAYVSAIVFDYLKKDTKTNNVKCDNTVCLESDKNIFGFLIWVIKFLWKFVRKLFARKEKMIRDIHGKRIRYDTKAILIMTRMNKETERVIENEVCCSTQILDMEPYNSFINPNIYKMKVDFERRQDVFQDILNLTDSDDFYQLSLIAFVKLLPPAYFEGFPYLYNTAKETCDEMSHIKAIIHSAAGNELLQLCYALLMEQGVKVYSVMHSSAYSALYGIDHREKRYYDYFVNWADGEGDISVPMQRKYIKSKRTAGNKILMVSGLVYLTNVMLGMDFSNYVESQMEFIDELDEQIRHNLVIRSNTNPAYTDLKMRVLAKYPYVLFENPNEVDFADSVAESGLIILDYYGSPVFEILALGKPFAFFEGAKINKLNPSIEVYFQEAQELGIFEKNGINLARTINMTCDYTKWLDTCEVRDFFDRFYNKFAGGNRDMIKEWIDFIKSTTI